MPATTQTTVQEIRKTRRRIDGITDQLNKHLEAQKRKRRLQIPADYLTPVNGLLSEAEGRDLAQFSERIAHDFEIPLRFWFWEAPLKMWTKTLHDRIMSLETWNTIAPNIIPTRPALAPARYPRSDPGASIKNYDVLLAGQDIVLTFSEVKNDPELQDKIYEISHFAATEIDDSFRAEQWWMEQLKDLLGTRAPDEDQLERYLATAGETAQLPAAYGYGKFTPDVVIEATRQYFSTITTLNDSQKAQVIQASIPETRQPSIPGQEWRTSEDLPPGVTTEWESISVGTEKVWKLYTQFVSATQHEYNAYYSMATSLADSPVYDFELAKNHLWLETLREMPQIDDIVKSLPSYTSADEVVRNQKYLIPIRLLAAYLEVFDTLINVHGLDYFTKKQIRHQLYSTLSRYDLWQYIQSYGDLENIYFNVKSSTDTPWIRPTVANVRRIYKSLNSTAMLNRYAKLTPAATPELRSFYQSQAYKAWETNTTSGTAASGIMRIALLLTATTAIMKITAMPTREKIQKVLPEQEQVINSLDTEADRHSARVAFLELNKAFKEMSDAGKIYQPDKEKITLATETLYFDETTDNRTVHLRNTHHYPVVYHVQPEYPFYMDNPSIGIVNPNSHVALTIFYNTRMRKALLEKIQQVPISTTAFPLTLNLVILEKYKKHIYEADGKLHIRDKDVADARIPPNYRPEFAYYIDGRDTYKIFTLWNNSTETMKIKIHYDKAILNFRGDPTPIPPGSVFNKRAWISRPPFKREPSSTVFSRVAFEYFDTTDFYWIAVEMP